MKLFIKKLFPVLLVLAFLIPAGCSDPSSPSEDPVEPVVTITVEVGGETVIFPEDDGTYTEEDFYYSVKLTNIATGEVKTVNVPGGGDISSAAAAVSPGVWEIEVTVKFSETSGLAGDTYAKGIETENIQVNGTISVTLNHVVKVTFDSKGGTPIAPQFVMDGGQVIQPQNQTRDEEVITGWYKDEGLSEKWDFITDTVDHLTTPSFTLYAKWEEMTQYTVYFNANGGGTNPSSMMVYVGDSFNLPTGAGLSKPGFTFGGWNTNDGGTGTNYAAGYYYMPTGDITLYAKWNPVGQPGETFEVNSVATLKKVGTGVDGWTLSANYIMTADINMTGQSWTPIGDEINWQNPKHFTGVFDGNGHTITGLTINSAESYQGLFGYVGNYDIPGAVVKNVELRDCNITGGSYYVGGLVGYNNNGTVQNCSVTGASTISSSVGSGDYCYLGGIVGKSNSGTVKNCYVAGSGTVTGSGYYIGGIVGNSDDDTIENCYVSVAVTGSGNYVGGIVGFLYDSTVQRCYTTSDVSGASGIGGIVGTNNGIIKNCYATGNITSTGGSSAYAGGVAGSNGDTVQNCYATGSVKVTATSGYGSDVRAGGVVGSNSGTLKNCVALNQSVERTFSTRSNLGRVAGIINTGGSAVITNSYSLNPMKAIYNPNDPDYKYYVPTPDMNDKDGADITAANANSPSWWNSASWDSSAAWDWTNTWDAATGTILPTLKGLGAEQNPSAQDVDDSGWQDGSLNYPFQINDETALRRMGTETVAGGWSLSSNYKLMVSIALTQGDWTPVGDSISYFSGTFNGNGYTISNLTTNTSSNRQGLFGFVNRYSNTSPMPKIENLTLANVSITGGNYVGSVASQVNAGLIVNCSVTSGTVNGVGSVGGIVGVLSQDCTAQDCHTSIPVTGTGDRIGGIVGSAAYGSIQNCFATGDITGVGRVGGVAGSISSVRNCYATGTVTGTGSYTGGLVGDLENAGGLVENCYATGNVFGKASTGGLVGNIYSGNIKNSYAKGNVVGTGSATGGLAGNSGGAISRCYATGTVQGAENVGGLVGNNEHFVGDSYATGNVTGTGRAGGVVGFNTASLGNSNTVKYCYATGNVTTGGAVGGITGSNYLAITDNCVALNKSISTMSTSSNIGGRILRNVDGTHSSNYGWSGSTLVITGIPVSTTSDLNGADGQDVSTEQAESASWWKTIAVWDTADWNFVDVWNEPSGGILPTLKNMPGNPVQEPKLQ